MEFTPYINYSEAALAFGGSRTKIYNEVNRGNGFHLYHYHFYKGAYDNRYDRPGNIGETHIFYYINVQNI